MASALDPYTPAEKAQQSGVPSIPGLDSLSLSPELAAHQMNQQAYQGEQIKSQQQALEAQRQAATREAQTGVARDIADPNLQKGWNDLTPEQRQGQQVKYSPLVWGDLPTMHNAAVSQVTGRPTGARITADDQASGEAAGVKFNYLPPNAPADENGQQQTSNRDALIQGFLQRKLPLTALPRQGPQRAQIIGSIMQQDPTWSPQDYEAQNKARESFVGQGKNGQSILSANTLVGHLGQANDLVDSLGNGSSPGLNTVTNAIGNQVGTKAAQARSQFATAADTAATEYAKMLSGGIPGQKEIESFKKMLDPNLPPNYLKRNIQQMAHAMGERLGNLQNEWKNTVKSQRDIPFLTPESRVTLDRLGVNHAAIDPVGAQQAPAVQSTPQPTAQPAQVQQPQLSAQDQAAIQWAQQNPTDPRAARIKQLHGIK